MFSVKLFTIMNLMIGFAVGTIQSDSGCPCVVTKTAVTAPNASASVAAGCSFKIDWTNSSSKWCLVDQGFGPCGTFQTGFGYADSCVNAEFSSLSLTEPVTLEWDQTGYTFYTGQNLLINWTARNINSDEWLRLTYLGAGGTRTLTTGSGVNVTVGTFGLRLSESANSLATNVPLTLATATSPSVYGLIPNVTILQSKIGTISVYDGNRSITTGTSVTSDDRNLTIMWRGIGQAQIGVATVTVRSSGGGTTVGTALTGIVAQANMSVNYVLPRSFTGGFGGTTYTAQISVQGPGAGVNPYTASSNSFLIAVAPTPTRTPTPSVTVTPTPTPSLSTGATASNTPTSSVTPTVSASLSSSLTPTISTSPSLTSTVSVTQTPSQTPAASLDLAAIAAAATAAANANTAGIVGGIVSALAVVAIGFAAYRLYERKQYNARRLRRLEASRDPGQYLQNKRALYGVTEQDTRTTTVMYQVTMPQPQSQGQRNMRQYASGRRVPQRNGV